MFALWVIFGCVALWGGYVFDSVHSSEVDSLELENKANRPAGKGEIGKGDPKFVMNNTTKF